MVGAIGRGLIGLAVVMLLFAAYQLWGTGIQEARAQHALEDEFDELLATADTLDEAGAPPSTTMPEASPGTTAPPAGTGPAFDPEVARLFFPAGGDPVARLSIPEIGVDKVVVEGVQVEDLRQGPGHYTSTPLPGQPGNAAIAGHRTTYGAPFHDIDQLDPGDEITVQTFQGTFTYRVLPQPEQSWDGGYCAARDRELEKQRANALEGANRSVAQSLPDGYAVGAIDGMTFFESPVALDEGIDEAIFAADAPGNFVVSPDQRCVLDDFGDDRLTLTACHPKYSSRQRIVVQALLVSAPAAPPVLPRPTDPEEGLGADETGATATTLLDPDDIETAGVPLGSDNDLDLNAGLGWSWEFLGPALAWTALALAIFALATLAARRWKRTPAYLVAAVPLVVVMFLAFEQIDKILPAI
ncbi:MAG: sortase [Acidimicrobiia bacterium]|nr:sortase [Acidimicrobiia bacterium]